MQAYFQVSDRLRCSPPEGVRLPFAGHAWCERGRKPVRWQRRESPGLDAID